jgi:indolepyruvate ferredoxin oxidoreductase
MIWPLEPQGMREFARGSQEVLVVEEKAAFLEPQIAHALFNLRPAERPRLFGKLDDEGRPLLPADVGLDSSEVALAIANRLSSLGVRDREVEARTRAILERRAKESGRLASPVKRAPYFCSGCPHNTSTRVPEGSLALSGIGCHTMAMGMNRHTLPPTHMGGEGMTWAGIAPFTSMSHVFQNLGDGTYFHSGLLAVRAAVAAKVNITYKLLVNDAVAMTGGQPVEGNLTLPEMSRQLAAEKVRRIAVVSDAPERWRSQAKDFAPGVSIHHRDELETLQRELRGIPGVTAILYEQTCAAEKRRRRKRGRRGGSSSTRRSARAAATVRKNPTACPSSRSRPSWDASAGSTSRVATRITVAARDSAHPSCWWRVRACAAPQRRPWILRCSRTCRNRQPHPHRVSPRSSAALAARAW